MDDKCLDCCLCRAILPRVANLQGLGPTLAHCSVQGCKVRATKQITINAAPNVLVVHLKRFEYSLYGHKISKKVRAHSHPS